MNLGELSVHKNWVVFVLMFLVLLAEAGLPWEGDFRRRDELLSGTARSVLAQYNRAAGGWLCQSEQPEQFNVNIGDDMSMAGHDA